MSTLVEIVCFNSQKSAQKIVEQHFKQTGDSLLVRHDYEELNRVLLVIQLLSTMDESEHTTFLRFALQEGMIESYEYLTCYPVSVFLDPLQDKQSYMQNFPLQEGESWFPAIDHPNKIYICLNKPFMTSSQTTWLIQHQKRWEYEDA